MTSSTRILIVEDALIAQMLTKIQLMELGCIVDIAANGVTALEKAKKQYYDLILMDISLGDDQDGFEVTAQIKKQSEKNKDTPIIAVTTHDTPEYAYRAEAVGMKRYYNKPLSCTDAEEMLQYLNS